MTSLTTDTRAGFVMPAVLSLLIILGIVLAALTLAARDLRNLSARIERDVRAGYQEESALALALDQLAGEIQRGEAAASSRTYNWNGMSFEVRLIDHRSRADLNQAAPASLASLFELLGMHANRAQTVASSIAERRLENPLHSIHDLALFGFDDAELECLSAFLTVHSGMATPQSQDAPIEVQQAFALEESQARRPIQYGTPIELDVRRVTTGRSAEELHVVLRFTGDQSRPLLIHEWRRRSQRNTPAQSAGCWRNEPRR